MILQVRREATVGGFGAPRVVDLLALVDDARQRAVRAGAVAPGWELEIAAQHGGVAWLRLAAAEFLRVEYDGELLGWYALPDSYPRPSGRHPDVVDERHFGEASAVGAVSWDPAGGGFSAHAERAFDALWEAHARRLDSGVYVSDVALGRRRDPRAVKKAQRRRTDRAARRRAKWGR